MNDPKPDITKNVSDWDAYWQGTGVSGAYSAGGATHPAILAFWATFFKAASQRYETPRMIDVACGNGAVISGALGAFGDFPIDVHCIDVSEAAISNIEARFPRVHGLVGDAGSIPLESGTFDIVTSQFGVEYAGPGAIGEAARLLAEKGVIALLLHSEGSKIHQECMENIDAIHRVQTSRFIPLAMDMFRYGFEAVQGAGRDRYDQAATRLDPAVKALEQVFEQYGEHVAGDTIARLYRDVGKIHAGIQQYDPNEVMEWLQQMERELVSFTGRMTAMSEAAIDEASFEKICVGLDEGGVDIQEAGPFYAADEEQPLAWALIATR